MRHIFKFVSVLIVILLLSESQAHVFAQDSNPPVDPNGAWSEVVNADGSINYASLSDGGVVTQPADWMPNIPLVGPIDAEYHVYYTPSGNTILMPTASTLFFMAANPNESGFNSAVSTLGTGGLSTAEGTNTFTGIAGLGTLFASLTGQTSGTTISLPNGEQIQSETFFQQVISGQQDIYALGPAGLTNLLTSLFNTAVTDNANGEGLNLYTYMLMYLPDQCASVPGGCTAEQLALLLPPVIETETPPEPHSCPAPVVTPGRIVRSGELVAPNYPLVVGQDTDKRGADIHVSVTVQPTIYTFWTQEPVYECKEGPNGNGVSNCTTDSGQPGHTKITDWICQQHQQSYNECVSLASATLRLTSQSQDWILNELSIQYPGAYVHKPKISFSASTGCQWVETYDRVQIEDPGNWDIYINGQTSGTPVSAPRPFGGPAGQFGVWLKETTIIK
jgi:hypothetical protein